MEHIDKQTLKNASFIMAGGACLMMLFAHLFYLPEGYNTEPMIPGLSDMAMLCFPTLALWMGIVLRYRFKAPKVWLAVVLICIAVAALYGYRHTSLNWRWEYRRLLCVPFIVIGYLFPPRVFSAMKEKRGWDSLVMMLVTVFCYTALSVVKYRVIWGDGRIEYPDMIQLLQWLLVNAEPLMALIATYFIVQFCFSGIGLQIGENSWFKAVVGWSAAFCFIASIVYLSSAGFYRFTYLNSWLQMLLQPGLIYLIIIARRISRRRRGELMTWAEVFTI